MSQTTNQYGNQNGPLRIDIPQSDSSPVTSTNSSAGNSEIGIHHDDEARLLSSRKERRGWRQYTSHERCLYISLGIVTLIALAFMAGVAVLSRQIANDDDDVGVPTKAPNTTILPPWLTTTSTTPSTTTTTTQSPSWNTCLTPDCAVVAGNMMAAMSTNPTVTPCTDFYEYACGGWIEKNAIQIQQKDNWDQSTMIKEQLSSQIKRILESKIEGDLEPQLMAQTFYKACMNQANTTIYAPLLKFVDFLLEDSDLGTSLGKIRRYLGGNFIFTTSIDTDAGQSENNTIYLDQPAFGVEKLNLLNTTDPSRVAYVGLIQKTWDAVYTRDPITHEIAAKIVAFEAKLAKISAAEEDRRNDTALYNPMLVNELYDLNKENKIDWVSYFTELYALPSAIYMETLPSNWRETTVIVRDVKYLEQIGAVLSGEDENVIRNFLKWRIIFTLINDFSMELDGFYSEFYKVTQGSLVAPKRWQTCADRTNAFFGMAVSYFFVQTHFSEEHFYNVQAMVGDIKNAFGSNLLTYDWMSEESKDIAKEKIDSMTAFIAYPEWLLLNVSDPVVINTTEFTILDYYQDLVLSTPADHFTNVLDLIEWHSERDLIRFGEPKDPKRWTIKPTTVVDTFYSPLHNSLTIPAGILQSPFYTSPSQYVNYGAIVATIAHEFLHGFDEIGQLYDPTGNLVDWWDESTMGNFTERSQCFVDQYNKYVSPETGLRLNGESTLNENIADNGALSLALQAYGAAGYNEKILPGFDNLKFTADQLFYLSFAQSFCSTSKPEYLEAQIKTSSRSPNRFRVKGVLENTAGFAATWSCPEPEPNEICKIW